MSPLKAGKSTAISLIVAFSILFAMSVVEAIKASFAGNYQTECGMLYVGVAMLCGVLYFSALLCLINKEAKR